jgi:hypothetical protein
MLSTEENGTFHAPVCFNETRHAFCRATIVRPRKRGGGHVDDMQTRHGTMAMVQTEHRLLP